MNLKGEGQLLPYSCWKVSFKVLSSGWVTRSLTQRFHGAVV